MPEARRTCPSCARESPPEFSFCPYCGSPLGVAPTASRQPARSGEGRPAAGRAPVTPCLLSEERKVVTTLFCDLVGYTTLSETHDHENVDAMLRTYATCARGIVEAHGGVVEKFIGDAVVAVFGFPRAHDDDPERAVRAALKIAAEVPKLHWPGDAPLAVRIGINTGETFLHTDIDPQSGETFLTGDAVNTAARLQSAAPPGGVVVGELTYSLIARAFLCEPLEHLTLKGKAEPVPAWLVSEPVSRTGLRTAGETATPFFGRQRELRALQDTLQTATETNRAQFVLIVGEPGIGKSRLVLEFAKSLDQRPDLVTWRQGRCLAYGEGVAFWALGEMLKAHAGILENDDVAVVEEKLEAVLPDGEQRPWFRQRLRPLLGLESTQTSREESFAAWTLFIAHIASSGPTVLVIEDLHWAGDGMLAFVEHLAAQKLEVPLLIVATTRPELLTKHPAMLAPIDDVGRVRLSPLTRKDAGHLVSALLDARIAADVRAPILERCGGNPLYAEEYVRLLLDRGLLHRAQGALRLREGERLPLPETVQAVLAARLDTLPPEHKAMLCDAAVFGESFWAGGVAALGGHESGDVREVMTLLAERQLVRPVVRSSLEGEAEFLFWHALARDVAYEQLPRRVRAGKHEKAALWVEESAGERSADFAEILAYHYTSALSLALALHDRALAVKLERPAGLHLAAAGEKTLRLDVSVAIDYYRKALELLPAGELARSRALYFLAEALCWHGRREEGYAAYEEAAASYLADADRNMAALCLIELAEFLANDGDYSRGKKLFERCLALLDEEHPSRALMLTLAEAAGMHLYFTGRAAAVEAADRSIAVSQRLGLPVPPYALEWRAAALADGGDFASAMREFRRAIEEGEAQGIGGELCRVYNNLAGTRAMWEGPEVALAAFRENVALARQRGMAFWELNGRCTIVALLADLGRWDDARAEAADVEPRVLKSGYAEHLVSLKQGLALVLAEREERLEADQAVEWLTEYGLHKDNPAVIRGGCFAIGAYARCVQGKRAEARELLLSSCDDELRRLLLESTSALLPLVRTAMECGDPATVEDLARDIRPLVPLDQIAALSVAAIVAAARGEHAEAAAGFADAAARWHDFGVPYEEAKAQVGRGRCLLALGRAPEAAQPLHEAHEIFARLGARPALAETDVLLAQVDAAVAGAAAVDEASGGSPDSTSP